jgi:hypothetical protein
VQTWEEEGVRAALRCAVLCCVLRYIRSRGREGAGDLCQTWETEEGTCCAVVCQAMPDLGEGGGQQALPDLGEGGEPTLCCAVLCWVLRCVRSRGERRLKSSARPGRRGIRTDGGNLLRHGQRARPPCQYAAAAINIGMPLALLLLQAGSGLRLRWQTCSITPWCS